MFNIIMYIIMFRIIFYYYLILNHKYTLLAYQCIHVISLIYKTFSLVESLDDNYTGHLQNMK